MPISRILATIWFGVTVMALFLLVFVMGWARLWAAGGFTPLPSR
jgi:hypothetical protein